MQRFLAGALGAWLCASVLVAASPPMPAESEWLMTRSGTIMVEGDPKGRDGRLRYLLEFGLRKPVTEVLYVTVDFENPLDKETPLFAEFEIAPGATGFEAKSEEFAAIRNRRKYQVKVWLYADVKRKQLLGTHEQQVLFQMPPELLERFGVQLL